MSRENIMQYFMEAIQIIQVYFYDDILHVITLK